jgi:flagellar assembly protein FliH
VVSGQQAEEVQQWFPPDMSGGKKSAIGSAGRQNTPALPTAADLEKLQQKAYEEGFEKGKEEGFAFGHKEGLTQSKQTLHQYTERMDALFTTLSEPLRELDQQVERSILDLVLAIVRQLVRREVKSDPNLIIGVVREALSILPVSSRNVRLLVHPDDAGLIREVYALGDSEIGWTLVDDPVISRGGCKVVTETSQVDATLDTRLASLIAPLLAGGRTQDEEQSSEEE